MNTDKNEKVVITFSEYDEFLESVKDILPYDNRSFWPTESDIRTYESVIGRKALVRFLLWLQTIHSQYAVSSSDCPEAESKRSIQRYLYDALELVDDDYEGETVSLVDIYDPIPTAKEQLDTERAKAERMEQAEQTQAQTDGKDVEGSASALKWEFFTE